METNKTPIYDMSNNPTGCCPRFDPEGWDYQKLHFEDKPFVKAETRSFFHLPVNMGSVFKKTSEAIQNADAMDEEQFLVLTRDISPWKAEHYFAVTKDVAGKEIVKLNGNFKTRVFEGPYEQAGKWYEQMKDQLALKGNEPEEIYFFYTTCPKCAKYYGKNYVVGFGKMD